MKLVQVSDGSGRALFLDFRGRFLWRGLGDETRQARRPRGLGIALSSVILASILWIRTEELVGRIQEIRRPVVGPVDAAIEFIQARYSDPAALMIATNYEAEPYMYYLGSRVVGRFHGGTAEADAAEAALEPDLVIPRSAQPRSLQAVRRYLMVHPFERHELPVADVAYNNIPELSPGRLQRCLRARPPLLRHRRRGWPRGGRRRWPARPTSCR
jgi:hypothetical protein